MRQIIIILASAIIGIAAYAKPQCQGFNNYDDKVTIVFTDDAEERCDISDVKLHTCGREHAATEIKKEVKNGELTVTLTFPHITQFSNPKVTLKINGKKTKFKVCR